MRGLTVTRGVLILLVVAATLGATSIAYRATALDLPTSIYIGRTILEGGVPYRDAWETRAPGIYFAFALGMLLLGKSVVGLRVFDILWQFVTAITLASIATRLSKKSAAGLLAGLIYLLLYYSQNFWDWLEPDGLLSLPLALALLFMLKAFDTQRLIYGGVAGSLVGVAAMFKLPYGLFGLGLPVEMLGLGVQLTAGLRFRMPLGRLLKKGLASAFGLSIPLLLCALFFYAKGGLRELLETQFVFAPRYVARVHAVVTRQDLIRSALHPYLFPLYVLLGLGLGRIVSTLVRRRKILPGEWLALGWLGVDAIVFFAHGSYLSYHYLPFVAPVALLSAAPIHSLIVGFGQRTRTSRVLLFAFAVILVCIPLKRLGEHAAYTWRAITRSRPAEPGDDLASYLRQKTAPHDTILVWGNAPVIYLRAERKAGTRFLCTAYLSIPTPDLGYRKIFMEELARNRPTYFVLAKWGSITPGLLDGPESFQQFPELQKYVASNYRLEMDSDLFAAYRRDDLP